MTTATQKTTDLLVAVLADLAIVVGGITAGQLPDPTPCTELDVGQLRTHVLGWLTTFAGGFADPGVWSNSAVTTEVGLNWYWNEYLKFYLFWLHANFGNPVQFHPGEFKQTADMFWLRAQLYF